MIPKAVSHLFWVAVEKGAKAAGQEFNVEILWNGPASETDYSRQIQIVDSMVAQRVDAIAVAATERRALVGAVDRAIAAGIPVTVFDSGLESTNYVSYVATDNVDAGRLAARKMAELMEGNGKCGLVPHAPGSASTMDREAGFQEAMAREFPTIRVVGGQFGMSDRARSRAAAENLLTAHPDLKGIFCSSEPSSTGTALAIKARGLTNQVNLVAFDSRESMVEDLRAGAIDAMVVQDPHRMGFEAVRTLVQKIKGQSPPKRLDLNATVIQNKDLNEPNVKRLLNLS
ncbi:MAG TPA: substrate-binding domain-containing protein [Bryobacteraceae bacterium]|nr:substrate-binding domain-containing protein [Bryobacteraceae bacterium]